MASDSADRVVLGCVTGHYGIKGWVKVKSYTRPSEEIFEFKNWFVSGQLRAVKNFRFSGKSWVVSLEGFDHRDQSESLIGSEISVEVEDLPELESGTYYWRDLIGLSVFNRSDHFFGVIKTMMETGANDVAVVFNEATKSEVLIPWIDQVLVQVDLKGGNLIVDWQDDYEGAEDKQ